MNRNGSRIILVTSALLLAAVIVAWSTRGGDDLRADLAGGSVSIPAGAPPESALDISTTTRSAPNQPQAAPAVVPGPSFPVRIALPTLGVDAPVVSVGLQSDGSMEIPGVSEAGWYQYGTVPGDVGGSAVIAAHVDYNRKPGVFFELRRLELGADIAVTDLAGEVHRYVVSERFQVDKQALPTPELFRSDGAPTLTLITCGGSFDRGARSYTDNIIVRAVPA